MTRAKCKRVLRKLLMPAAIFAGAVIAWLLGADLFALYPYFFPLVIAVILVVMQKEPLATKLSEKIVDGIEKELRNIGGLTEQQLHQIKDAIRRAVKQAVETTPLVGAKVLGALAILVLVGGMAFLGTMSLQQTQRNKEALQSQFTSVTRRFQAEKNALDSYSLGEAELGRGNYDIAATHFTEAISQRTDFVDAFVGRGIAKSMKHDYARALVDFGKATRLNPEHAEASYNLARMLGFANKKSEEVLEELEKAVQLNTVYKKKAGEDEAFKKLRQDERFKKLIEE